MQQIHGRLILVALVLLALAAGSSAAKAQQYCADVCCYLPPRASCTDQCLNCGANSGTEYPYPPYCQYPEVIPVAECGCSCLQSSSPNISLDKSLDPDELLRQLTLVPLDLPSKEAPDAVTAPKADVPREDARPLSPKSMER